MRGKTLFYLQEGILGDAKSRRHSDGGLAIALIETAFFGNCTIDVSEVAAAASPEHET